MNKLSTLPPIPPPLSIPLARQRAMTGYETNPEIVKRKILITGKYSLSKLENSGCSVFDPPSSVRFRPL